MERKRVELVGARVGEEGLGERDGEYCTGKGGGGGGRAFGMGGVSEGEGRQGRKEGGRDCLLCR